MPLGMRWCIIKAPIAINAESDHRFSMHCATDYGRLTTDKSNKSTTLNFKL